MTRRHWPLAPRRLRFEGLENRTLPAGNVTAAVVGGALQITGDVANNSITITKLDSDTFQIAGAATRINGHLTPQRFDGVVGDISLDMRNGSDTVFMTGGTLPANLTALMGIGNDFLRLSAIRIRGDLGVGMEGGNDTFSMSTSQVVTPDSFVRGQFLCSGGPGNDSITVSYSEFSHDLGILGSSEDDTITVLKCDVAADILINAEQGNDSVTVQSNFAHDVNLALGDGDNTATFVGGQYSNNVTITGGEHTDTVSVTTTRVAMRLTIDTGLRTDTVELTSVISRRYIVDVGFGRDQLVNVELCRGNRADFTCLGRRNNTLSIDTFSELNIQSIMFDGFQNLT